MKPLIIIPAFNEAKVIGSVIDLTRKTVSDADILVVDDGSGDSTGEVAKKKKAKVVRHILNRGLGGAIGTGLAYAKQHGYGMAVTMDADGQHDPLDAKKVFYLLKSGKADVVIGSRLISTKGSMPADRILINRLANFFTYLMFGVLSTDSQSGFRGFNRRAIESINIRTDRMEVSTEIFSEIKRLKLKFAEVPIKVIYSDYSRAKGQRNSNAISILYKLMIRLFR